MFDYERQDLATAFGAVGMCAGDVVFSHSNIGFFGRPQGVTSLDELCELVFGAFDIVLGPTGTLVVPTFSYSYCKDEVFDVAETPSTCGAFTEWVRRHPEAHRSHDPLFSVAAVGARAAELVDEVSKECFGRGSFWDRLLAAEGLICNLNFDAGSTYLHFVEKQLGVTYRQDRTFAGVSVAGESEEESEVVYFSRPLEDPTAMPAFEKFDGYVRDVGVCRTEDVGKGAVVALRARSAFEALREGLHADPYLMRNTVTAQ